MPALLHILAFRAEACYMVPGHSVMIQDYLGILPQHD